MIYLEPRSLMLPTLLPLQLYTLAEIQGSEHISPLLGQRVLAEGVVTSTDRKSFTMQDGTAGLLVYTSEKPSVSPGDKVSVEGTVDEFRPTPDSLSTTQLSGGPVVRTLSANHSLPPPIQLATKEHPLPVGKVQAAAGQFERYESRLVEIPGGTVISPTNRFGEVVILPDDLAHLSFAGILRGNDDTQHPSRLRVVLDPKLYSGKTPQLNVGDRVGPIRGPLLYRFGLFGIQPIEPMNIQRGSCEPEVTSLEGTEWGMTVASYNVQNLDPAIEDREKLGERGRPDDDVGDGKFARIAEHVAKNLRSPDVIGVQEIQDNNGSERDSTVSAKKTWETLIAAIVDAGGPRYEWIDSEPQSSGDDGGQPGGNIRVGYLYNPERVDLLRDEVRRIGENDPAFERTRKPLAAAFRFKPTGTVLHTVVNHWSSALGSTPTFRAIGTPAVIGGAQERMEQQRVVGDYINELVAKKPEAKLASFGDLNAPENREPIRAHGSGILFNVGDRAIPSDRYSSIYNGLAKAIDHLIATRNLESKSEIDYVHVNAGFADGASDHDPFVVRFDMRPEH